MLGTFSLSRVNSLRMSFCRNFSNISNVGLNLNRQCTNCQLTFVRHKKVPMRKPSWMPRAKTKLFRFPERKIIPEEELDQINELYSNYKAQMESIVAYCAAELKHKDANTQAFSDEEEFTHILKVNEEENERVQKIREAVLAAELEAQTEALLEMDRLEKEWHHAKKEEVESIIKYEKAASVNFVTLENIEEVISKAIDNPVNYNFAIDTKGKILVGTEPLTGGPYWTDDIPRERLLFPPSQTPQQYRKKKKKRAFEYIRRWC